MFGIIKIFLCLLPTIVFPFSTSSTRLFSIVSAQRQPQPLMLPIPMMSVLPPLKMHIQNESYTLNSNIPDKFHSYVQITRINKNFVPTTVLILLSGCIGNSQWKQWFFTKRFVSIFMMVHLITSASMVINDIFDLRIDRINNPMRPLASGKISLREAATLFIGLSGICMYIGRQIPTRLHPYWVSSLVLVTAYTPIFKQITFLKNVVCAGIVTLTVPFVGLSTAPPLSTLKTLPWMLFFMNILFVHSFCNEILLDMLDIEGDALCGIPTLPVILGKYRVLRFLMTGLYGNALMVGLSVLFTRNYKRMGMMLSTLVITYHQLLSHMRDILQSYFSEKTIRHTISSSTQSMVFCFIMYILYSVG
jgi:geranylgeranylglycerol-phosphate geranylgeranyltransferase